MRKYWQAFLASNRRDWNKKELARLRRYLVSAEAEFKAHTDIMNMKTTLTAVSDAVVEGWINVQADIAVLRHDIGLLVQKLKDAGVEQP